MVRSTSSISFDEAPLKTVELTTRYATQSADNRHPRVMRTAGSSTPPRSE
jgi:hypothetical protein